MVGTLRYMAPERFDGRSDPRSDVYALGATLYELLDPPPAVRGRRPGQLIERVLHEGPIRRGKLDPRIPRDLETIVLKAMAKEPAGRYATAGAMADDLQPVPRRPADPGAAKHPAGTPRPPGAAQHGDRGIAGGNRRLADHGPDRSGDRHGEIRDQVKYQSCARLREQDRAPSPPRRRAAALSSCATRRPLRFGVAETTLTDMHTSYGLVAVASEDPAEAVLWFANAAHLAANDPDRALFHRVSARLWSTRPRSRSPP